MNLKQTIFTAALFASAAFCGDISAQEKIALPEPAITGGMPLNTRGATNMLQVKVVD